MKVVLYEMENTVEEMKKVCFNALALTKITFLAHVIPVTNDNKIKKIAKTQISNLKLKAFI